MFLAAPGRLINRRRTGAFVNRPNITVPGAQGILLSSAPLVFASSISVSDAVDTSLTISLTFTGGTITLDGTTGLSFSVGDGTADATMTFSGTITNINNALSGMSVTAGSTGDRTLAIVATNTTGSRSASVAVQFGAVPVNTVAPVISGANDVGATLTCTTGTWTGYPTPTLSYQWYNEGAPVSGATGSTYVVTLSDDTDGLTCRVTGTNAYGSDSEDSNEILIGDVLPEPILTLTSAPGAATPTFTATFPDGWDVLEGDSKTIEYSETESPFVVIDSDSNSVDAAEDTNEELSFSLDALSDGNHFARVRYNRAGWVESISNIVGFTVSSFTRRQFMIAAGDTPQFINTTAARQYMTNGVYVNEV